MHDDLGQATSPAPPKRHKKREAAVQAVQPLLTRTASASRRMQQAALQVVSPREPSLVSGECSTPRTGKENEQPWVDTAVSVARSTKGSHKTEDMDTACQERLQVSHLWKNTACLTRRETEGCKGWILLDRQAATFAVSGAMLMLTWLNSASQSDGHMLPRADRLLEAKQACR